MTEINLSVIKNFEASSYKFPERVIDKTRAGIVNMLSKNTYCNKHMNYMDSFILSEFNKCKNFLKNNEELMITKADKGQINVVLNKSKYVEQMTKTLDDDSTYKKILKDPLKILTNKTNNMLKMWWDYKIIDDSMYKALRCTNGNLPRCYGLPKVHKQGFPLRIVVSSVGSPLYDVGKYLHEIINNSIKKPASNIKDSWSFVSRINKTHIETNEIMISLDVTSLFNNIPKELVIQGIRNRWNDIQKTTKMSISQMLNAIELVLSSTSFKFNGKYYEQIYGSPMGSPLSPILADIVMEDLEVNCLQKMEFKIHTYYRYVDDIFLIIPESKIENVLKTFNEYHPRLKFTHEIENNNSISFLNTLVIRGEDGKITTNWYRKPTFSGRYINYFSNHPEQYKNNIIDNLVDQAILLSDERFHSSNLEVVKTILRNNCYPVELINKKIKNRLITIKKNKISEECETNDNKDINKTMVVPYVKNISFGIKRIVKNCVNVRFSIPKKLDSIIKKGKDKLEVEQNTGVVYRLDCEDCEQVYIGQTKRHLETRVKEHRNNIKNASGNYSVVTNHRLSTDHEFKWDNVNILHKERNRRKREIAEMFFIKKYKKNNRTLNLQKDTDNLNPIYDKIIT